MTKPLTHNEMISAIFAANTEAFRLEGELEKVTKERDEARRMASRLLTEDGSLMAAKSQAFSIGWDCFKEENHNA